MQNLIVAVMLISFTACSSLNSVNTFRNDSTNIKRPGVTDSSQHAISKINIESGAQGNLFKPDSLVENNTDEIAATKQKPTKKSRFKKFIADTAMLLVFFAVIGVTQGASR